MASLLRQAVLAIRFLTELALFAVLILLGVNAGLGTAANVAIAVLAPVTAVVIWGIGIAPRARRRWPLAGKPIDSRACSTPGLRHDD